MRRSPQEIVLLGVVLMAATLGGVAPPGWAPTDPLAEPAVPASGPAPSPAPAPATRVERAVPGVPASVEPSPAAAVRAWETRLREFRKGRAALLARPDLSAAEREAAVAALLAASFGPEERPRVEAFDRIAKEP